MISSTAIFACSDIEATLAFYKEVLGFDSTWTVGDPPTFGSASMGGVNIMFNLQPQLAKNVPGHEHWIRVDDIDGLYEVHKGKGASIVSDLADRPWGFREYVLEDLNGYHLRFASSLQEEVRASRPFPKGVTIVRRKSTPEEYSRIAGKEFGHKEAHSDLLANTWSGVVALDPDGDAIGVLRIMWDAPAWYSIWDFAVLPVWREQRIGSAMMREALEAIREASPGANVHLFTYKHGFYERLGFTEEKASLRRV